MYRGGTAMFFLISWWAANNEGLFLDKSAKSSPCQVKCPNQNQGSQLLRAVRYYHCSGCIICSFQRQRFYVQLSVCLKLKAEKQWGFGSQSLPGHKIQFQPSISPDCLTVLILWVQIDQMMVVAPGVAYGTYSWRELYSFWGKPSEKYFWPLGGKHLEII